MVDFLKNIYHYCLAWLGNIIYGFPSKKIFVLGVTGTKGKSTTVELINSILETAGKKTALLSSVRFKIGKSVEKNRSGMTMPGRFFIQNFLRKAVNSGCEYAIIEVTSQGILQHRHKFIDWNGALFLNLQPEHIEAHGSFENYRRAKVSFFEVVAKNSGKREKFFIVNEGDPSHEYFAGAADNFGKVIYFSREGFIEKDLNKGKESIGDWLSNDFNLENAAAAAAFAESQGIPWFIIKKALGSFKGVPGRMEIVKSNPFRVVIDYAHTPDSLEKIYQTLVSEKRKVTNRKLICVLGAAGGGRDKWKRPEMGKIAAGYCREIVLTNEDPYDENPLQILSEIKSGISYFQFPASQLHETLDRREAIETAIKLAKKGDTVIVTGKGSEDWIHLARGKKIPWSEKKVIEDILKSLK